MKTEHEVTLEITIKRYVGRHLQGHREWKVTHNSDVQIDKLEDCIAYVAGAAEKLSTLNRSSEHG